MSTPQIPPRPVKMAPPSSTDVGDAPKIPPRPAHRALERSKSKDNFPRSPLNEVPSAMNHGSKRDKAHNPNDDEARISSSVPERPPSVSLPSVGQEGSEYADIVYEKPQEASKGGTPHNEPEQTRNVGRDLPLHAPTPSFSTAAAKARVSAVTRTDSVQAAAAGIGKPGPQYDDKNPHGRVLHPKISFSRTESSASTDRPDSVQATESDHGIPEIGRRVPMYPDAGDVQAPSPAPFLPNIPPGAGLEGSQRTGRHHSRTRSGREVFRGPPGSYGMHGHGVQHTDQFEKAWYDKHPDAFVREESGQYGPGIGGGRGEWALSSEDLNKIVRETAARGSGFGTSADIAGLPNEQIGYIATEEYASRINAPSTASYHNKAHSNHSQAHVDSPLRKASFPAEVDSKAEFEDSQKTHGAAHPRSESALESETEDDEIHVEEIHVDEPAFRASKYTGNGYDPPTEDLGPRGGNTDSEGGWIQETGYGVPILASDEVAKVPGSEFLQPAVSPLQERRGSNHYAGIDLDAPPLSQSEYRNHSRPGSASNSRPSSRPGSIHGSMPGLARLVSHDEREDMHTPLENVDEYEPLFPEEEDKPARPVSLSATFNRPEGLKRRFPSQDIWEDTPNSLQLQATVETPEPIEESETSIGPETPVGFESPGTERARKGESADGDRATLTPTQDRLATSNVQSYLREETDRPESKQRFPSRDIWEDCPDSAQLETTVEEPESDGVRSPAEETVKAGEINDSDPQLGQSISDGGARHGSPPDALEAPKPGLPQRPETAEKSTDSASQPAPVIPARPSRRVQPARPANITSVLPKTSTESSPTDAKQGSPSEIRKAPVLPDRPKPQIPARPPRSAPRDGSEMIPLSKSISASSAGSGGAKEEPQALVSPPGPKPKPTVPSRPIGGKIASLKAGFLSDLDKRLQMGPQAPKASEKIQVKPEAEEEKAPLADARKGRAKGPARRKPAAPPAIAAVPEEEEVKSERPSWVIQEPWTVWQTEEDGTINAVHALPPSASPKKSSESAEAPSPLGPLPSNDSMSAVDTPTSSRDETMPLPDELASSDEVTADGAKDPQKEEVPSNTAHSPALPPTSPQGTEGADEADDKEATDLGRSGDLEQHPPTDLSEMKQAEGSDQRLEAEA